MRPFRGYIILPTRAALKTDPVYVVAVCLVVFTCFISHLVAVVVDFAVLSKTPA